MALKILVVTASFLGICMVSPAPGDPSSTSEIVGFASDVDSNGTAGTSRPDQLLLDEAQTSRLNEIADLKVEFDSRRVPTRLEGQLGFYTGDAPDAELRRLLQELGPAYRAKGTESLRQANARVNSANIGIYRTGQYIDEIPVIGAGLIIVTDAITGQIKWIQGNFLPDRDLPKKPEIPAADVKELAAEAIAFKDNVQLQRVEARTEPELVYHISGHLAWRLSISYQLEDDHKTETVMIDAVNGSFIHRDNDRVEAIYRKIIDDKRTLTSNDDVVVLTEGGTTSNVAAQNAYKHAKTIYDRFSFLPIDRDSYDDAGAHIVIKINSVDIGSWDKVQKVVRLGPNDAKFENIPNDQDVIAHELFHALVQDITATHENSRGLGDTKEADSINEAYADIFAARTAWQQNQGDERVWQIAEDSYIDNGDDVAVRYLLTVS